MTGPCPFTLDPDRPKRAKANRQFMSFGDGPHRCPGAQLALHEARIFLDKVLRLSGIRLVGKPRFECCLLYTSPSPRDRTRSRMPSSA